MGSRHRRRDRGQDWSHSGRRGNGGRFDFWLTARQQPKNAEGEQTQSQATQSHRLIIAKDLWLSELESRNRTYLSNDVGRLFLTVQHRDYLPTESQT